MQRFHISWSQPRNWVAGQGVCHQPSKLVMRVRFPSPAPRKYNLIDNFRFAVRLIAVCCRLPIGMVSMPVFYLFKQGFRTELQ